MERSSDTSPLYNLCTISLLSRWRSEGGGKMILRRSRKEWLELGKDLLIFLALVGAIIAIVMP
jgi:hypothetical protein